MNTIVPTMKKRLRTLVTNSRRAIRKTVCSASRERGNFLLRHRSAKDLQRAGFVAPELEHRPAGKGGAKDGLGIGRAVQLDQDARAIRPDDPRPGEAVCPARA